MDVFYASKLFFYLGHKARQNWGHGLSVNDFGKFVADSDDAEKLENFSKIEDDLVRSKVAHLQATPTTEGTSEFVFFFDLCII